MVESHETSPLTTQLASFRQWGRPPGLQPDLLVGFGRVSGPPTVRPRSQPPDLGFVSPTVSGLRPKPQGQPPLTGNWLRLVKSRPVGQASRPVHPIHPWPPRPPVCGSARQEPSQNWLRSANRLHFTLQTAKKNHLQEIGFVRSNRYPTPNPPHSLHFQAIQTLFT